MKKGFDDGGGGGARRRRRWRTAAQTGRQGERPPSIKYRRVVGQGLNLDTKNAPFNANTHTHTPSHPPGPQHSCARRPPTSAARPRRARSRPRCWRFRSSARRLPSSRASRRSSRSPTRRSRRARGEAAAAAVATAAAAVVTTAAAAKAPPRPRPQPRQRRLRRPRGCCSPCWCRMAPGCCTATCSAGPSACRRPRATLRGAP